MKETTIRVARENLEWLKNQQVLDGFDQGGIEDPILDRVVGDNYATEEFAVGLGTLIARGEIDGLRDSFVNAMDFHARTTAAYPFGNHTEHYQHRRLGFIEAYNVAKNFNSRDELDRWKNAIESWSIKKNTSNCNWYAMNAVLDDLVYRETGNSKFRLHAWYELARTMFYWEKRGFFSDSFDAEDFDHVSPSYDPIAYHAYTSALLHRYWLNTGNGVVRQAFLRAAKLLFKLIPNNGHVAFRGRSSGHIFTYGVGYYVMVAAARETGEGKYTQTARGILERLQSYQRSDGRFPVVANKETYEKRVEFQASYSYHSVYNAHCSAWLARAIPILEAIDTAVNPPLYQKRTDGIDNVGGGLYIITKSEYFVVISTGSGGNYDGAFSIAMLDIDGALGTLPPPASENKPVSGNFCRVMKDGIQLWSNIRKKGEFDIIKDGQAIGTKSIRIANSELNWKRTFTFGEDSITIRDIVSSNNFPLHECTLQTGFSIPDNSDLLDQISDQKLGENISTVLGDGRILLAENQNPSKGQLETELTINI